jgi:hypothetical protein
MEQLKIPTLWLLAEERINNQLHSMNVCLLRHYTPQSRADANNF